MNSLIVPVVLWGGKPPTHKIRAIAATKDQRHILTGCADGQICIWDVNKNGTTIQPKMILFGHSSSVVGIAPVLHPTKDTKFFVSASLNSEIFLWDITDGRCVEQTRITGSPSKLISIQINISGKLEPCLLCIGLFAEIFIISAMTLETVVTLLSRIYPDWIACCTVIQSKNELSVIGLTMSGTIKVWQVPNNLLQKSSTILEDESKQLRCQNAVHLSHSKRPIKLLLVVCPFDWQLYDAGDFSLLCIVQAPDGVVLSGGDFLETCNKVVMWDQNGIIYIYALPFPPHTNDISMDSVKAYAKEKLDLLYCFSFKKGSDLTCPPSIGITALENGNFMLYSGNSNSRVALWSISKSSKTAKCIDSINLQAVSGLNDHWDNLVRKPTGIIDNLGKDTHISVTTSLYLENWGQLACGREDGSIVIVPAARACKSQLLRDGPMTKKCWIPHRTLRGHSDRVTCLLYPHEESDRYSAQIFISGSADFSVVMWELFSGIQLHVFNVHGGEIAQLIVPPEECSQRIQQSICSVASDHSVAMLSMRERKCVMLAASHTSMVTSIKWRPLDDFILVSCADGALFVWQMETGHLDRHVTGATANHILEACDELQSNRTDNVVQGSVNLSQAFKRRSLAGFKAAAQQGLRNIIETIEDKMQDGEADQPNPNVALCTRAMLVQPIRASPTRDDDSHILFFNTEAIIGTLLREQALRKKMSRSQKQVENGNSASSARKVINAFIYQVKNQLLESSDQVSSTPVSPNVSRKTKDKEKKSNSMEVDTIMNIAQLLLSCLHGWGLDPNLDNICKDKLGIFEPIIPICFGLLSREGQMALMLPTWTRQDKVKITATENHQNGLNHTIFKVEHSREVLNGDFQEKCSHLEHWEVSSTVTTHHLISVIAVANTMMELSNVGSMTERPTEDNEPLTEDSTSGNHSEGVPYPATDATQVKQGLALLATTHCVLLPELLDSPLYKPPKLEMLARRWQDRCLEVRDAAQALLLAKLRQIAPDGRRKIVEEWAKHMPDYIQQQHIDLVPNTRTDESPNPSTPSSPCDDILDKSSISSTELASEAPTNSKPSAQKISYETRRRQATAVIILGVIGAEFGQEMEPSKSNTSSPCRSNQGRSEVPDGFKLSSYSLARNTCKALVYLLLYPASPRLPAHAPIRRAAIDLLGRGFTVWEPYIEVSAVLLGLLELCVDYEAHRAGIQSGLPLSAKADSCRSSHHALCLIATARPLTFITTIAREVARHNAAAANPQHQALLATSIIVRARGEVLRIIELLAEKMMTDVMDLLVEVMDIILFCIDTNSLRTANSLVEAIPALTRFHSISYDPKSRRIAVGTRRGSIYFYDLRTNKHQNIYRGRHAIATLAFSPEGKYLSAYSIQDNHLSFWTTSSSLFGMLQSQVKCVKTTRLLPAAISQRLASSPDNTRDSMKSFVKLAWVNNRTTVLLLPEGSEYRCHV